MFVLAKGGEPLMPCHPARARALLDSGRAVVARRAPFAIRLKHRTRTGSTVEGVQLRLDPGSKATGIAITDERRQVDPQARAPVVRRGLIAIELRHRGQQIHRGMMRRAGYRRRRRSANLRYRAPRYENRPRPAGWLPPSLRHRIDATLSLVTRLCRYAPVVEIHVEQVAFDTAAVAGVRPSEIRGNPDSTLAGSEVREFLLAKWNRSCAYCGATGVPLNIEHVRPRSRGGSDRMSNLVLACIPCNQAKGTSRVEEFLSGQPTRLADVITQLRKPLQDVAVMNATRLQVVEALTTLGVPVHTWSGGRTRWNRFAARLPKSHTLDALATGVIIPERGDAVVRVPAQVLVVTSTGRGSYARTTPDRFGFPRLQRPRGKVHHGYATGDLVEAVLSKGKWVGKWVGRIAVRTSGQHRITTLTSRFDVSHRNLRLLQRADGYTYGFAREIPLNEQRRAAYSGPTLKGGDPGNV
ncbi:RNA-guided endonuclease IscB [Streptomyces sp. NBC_01294]|uniref:RNA-guided endonuclease IscB n=1 Tax=Streptomyces sp. NBC_01294 TaxID=2903815 RepID=UPI002DDA0053|nr:RNA-guided endonuclease IscB [Streptomyces sp. NBC_01294]WRZ58674.1 RNA-guided endonuclease IscB [Streptomyces sp. NBC_01294]